MCDERVEEISSGTSASTFISSSYENSGSKSSSGSSKNSEDEQDVSTPSWFYQDANGVRQGPFSFKEIYIWWKSGYFPNSLLVKSVWESRFRRLDEIPEFYRVAPKMAEKLETERDTLVRGYLPPLNFFLSETTNHEIQQPNALGNATTMEDYKIVGSFNPLSGKFQKEDGLSHFSSKGLPSDRDMRMMSHYFDYEKYQEQMNAAKVDKEGKGKKKKIKGTKKFWKEHKEKKKRRKMLAEYLAD